MSAPALRPATIDEAQRFFRIVAMAHELLEEVHVRPLDRGGRERLGRLFDQVLSAAEDALPEPLRGELARLAAHVDADRVSDGELRVALAELVGWLEGTVMSTPFMVPMEVPADEEVSLP